MTSILDEHGQINKHTHKRNVCNHLNLWHAATILWIYLYSVSFVRIIRHKVKLTLFSALVPIVMHSIYIGQLVQSVAAPLVMHMHGYIRDLATVRNYQYTAVFLNPWTFAYCFRKQKQTNVVFLNRKLKFSYVCCTSQNPEVKITLQNVNMIY